MSAQLNNKSISFGDDTNFDPHSTPNIEYDIESSVPITSGEIIKISPAEGITGTVETQTIIVGPICEIHAPPWPTIIISVLGAIVVIYTAVAPNVDENRRIFGIVLMTLWTIIWALILWVLWRECQREASWWLLLIPVIMMALFFILIIVIDVGSSI